MVAIGATLMRQRGFVSTSLLDVVNEGGLPRGSIYHHFPGGKLELAQEAIRYAASEVAKDLLEVAARAASAPDAVELYVELLADRLERSNFADGCWYATAAMEVATTEPELSRALDREFERWETAITQAFIAWGLEEDRARSSAGLIIAAVEGGLLRARLGRDTRHLRALVPFLRTAVT